MDHAFWQPGVQDASGAGRKRQNTLRYTLIDMHRTAHLTELGISRRGSTEKLVALALALLVLSGAIVYLVIDPNSADSGGNEQPAGAFIEPYASDTLVKGDPNKPDNNLASTNEDSIKISTYTLPPELLDVLNQISRGQYMDARANLALSQKNKPAYAPAEFLHGLSFHKEKRYELARPFFEKAIKIDSGYRPTWYFYGWCLYYLGELKESRAAFEHHLKMDPLEGDSHYGIALIDLEEGHVDHAETELNQAIDLQENNPRRKREVSKAHARLGDVYVARDQLEEAKQELTLATQIWPAHYEAHFKLARVLYRLGEDEAAGEEMRVYELIKQHLEGEAPPAKSSDESDVTPSHEDGPVLDEPMPEPGAPEATP